MFGNLLMTEGKLTGDGESSGNDSASRAAGKGKRKAEDPPVAEGDNIPSGKRGTLVVALANT